MGITTMVLFAPDGERAYSHQLIVPDPKGPQADSAGLVARFTWHGGQLDALRGATRIKLIDDRKRVRYAGVLATGEPPRLRADFRVEFSLALDHRPKAR